MLALVGPDNSKFLSLSFFLYYKRFVIEMVQSSNHGHFIIAEQLLSQESFQTSVGKL